MAAQRLQFIELKDDRTIWHNFHVKVGATSIFAYPKPEGKGNNTRIIIRTKILIIILTLILLTESGRLRKFAFTSLNLSLKCLSAQQQQHSIHIIVYFSRDELFSPVFRMVHGLPHRTSYFMGRSPVWVGLLYLLSVKRCNFSFRDSHSLFYRLWTGMSQSVENDSTNYRN